MASSDALRVVEDWISEHYFTSDATNETFHKRVLERRKEWDAAEQPTSKSRITAARRDLLAGISNLYPDATSGEALADAGKVSTNAQALLIGDDTRAKAAALYESFREALGFQTGEFHCQEDAQDNHSPVRRYAAHGLSEYPLAIIDAAPVQTLEDLFTKGAPTLLSPWRPDEETEPLTSVSRALSQLFTPGDGTAAAEFALVMAGRWLVVAEAGRWPQGRYLGVDLQTVLERDDTKRAGELDTAITCIDAQSLAPDQDGAIWWADTLEDSARHTVGVSADLREGVRTSIEIIANEVVNRRRAKNLPPLPDDQAQPLAKQALRFLYRILFLLYAEASPQLGILPVGAPEYDAGYSVDRLRDLLQVRLTTQRSREGTHLYESLGVLFDLIDHGHPMQRMADDAIAAGGGLAFHSLRADLFESEATELIDQVGLGNEALQKVLSKLLLTKEAKGRERGFISYVELGINQLGAVYEGLMSYTGFFASEPLYEVAHDGDPSKGSWVVPIARADDIDEKDFVRMPDPDTGERVPRRYGKGEFVFRLSGRERQQSASYYTPEVLTRFTVGQALEELLDQDGETTPADDILKLSICEPALGSGAFAIEAVNQLATQYLKRKQKELGRHIDPEKYPDELQKVKASIALHQVYGVDLNATAVEFAEITLWLSSMAKDLQAPWFGLHLRRGNSLIGARRAVYRRDQIMDKSWLTTPPTDVPLTDIAGLVGDVVGDMVGSTAAGRIPHWLMPAAGWGSTAESKEAKKLVPDTVKAIKAWRRRATGKPTKKEVDRLVDLGYQAEELWTMAYRRLSVAEQQTRRSIPLWGQEKDDSAPTYVTREQIEASLADSDGAYRRLRRVMDAWCALWFWPLTTDTAPPDFTEWLDVCEQILGARRQKDRNTAATGADSLSPANEWDALADQENFELAGAGATPHVEDVVDQHPWLKVCQQVAEQQGFFHWQLDFATIFGRGGFDLQLGNPPWVRPDSDVDALLAEGDPWWMLARKPSVAVKKVKREQTLVLPGMTDLVTQLDGEVVAQREYVGSAVNFPVLDGLRPDLYRCFMKQVWAHESEHGISSLVHPETHFTDEKAGYLRENTYQRLRRHWQLVNELQMFAEVDHHVSYGVHVYGCARDVNFDQATALYHPDTVVNSYRHNGDGEEPGFKYQGHWDTRPHRSRIQRVTDLTLNIWRNLLESPDVPPRRSRMVYTVNREVADVLARLAQADRIGSLGLRFSAGWNETTDRVKGYFVQRWGVPDTWDDVILQGPHLHVANPAYKQPNPTMKNNEDWSLIDLERLAADAIPATAYKPAGDRGNYDRAFVKASGLREYRVGWRAMAANTGERTLIPAILPAGAGHLFTIRSVGADSPIDLARVVGVLSSLIADFEIRSVPRAHILLGDMARLPLPPLDHPLIPALVLRTLRLNCLTNAYADLWAECWNPAFATDTWTLDDHTHTTLGDVTPDWSMATPLRRDADRRQALVEIDALVALMLGIPAEELCTVYRTQFAVLYGYDHGEGRGRYIYDANGRVIPNTVYQAWKQKGDNLSWSDRTATNASSYEYTYELPYTTYDREVDMTRAYEEFERRLARMNSYGSEARAS